MRPKLCQEAGRGTWRGGRLPIGDRTRDWTRGPQPWVRRESSAVAPQLVEEAVNDAQFAGTGKLVVDMLADRKVEHPRPNGENTTGRPVGTVTRPAITSSSVPSRKSRLPVSCSARCGEVSAFRQ